MSPSLFLEFSIKISFAVLAVSMGLVLIRIFRGPSLCNRVVALDLMTTLMVCSMGSYIIRTGQSVLLYVPILAVLVTFLGTVGYAYYVEREKE